MRRILLLAACLFFCASVQAQVQQSGNTILKLFPGAPSGTCSAVMVAVNSATGDFYDCLSGAWHLVAGGGGGPVTFDLVGSGTNVTATMTVGNGATLTFAAGGIVNASTINGVTVTGTPGIGQLPIATGPSGAVWADPIMSGPDANGAAPTGNPLMFAGWDGTNTRRLKTDSGGVLQMNQTGGNVTLNTTSPLGGGGTVAFGGTLTFTCASCNTSNATVSNFSAGNLSPLFTSSVATSTTTPALTFTLSNAAANTVFGNFTGGSAVPTFSASPVFSAASLTNFPTFNQSTSGNAATATALASTPTNCGAGVAAIGILANGNATGCFTPSGLANPMTTLGDIIYGASSGTPTRLGANSTGTNQFLRSVSSGVPVWAQPTITDVAGGTSSANYALTGTNTAGKLNGICIVDGVQNATLAAAVTCAGSSGVIEISMFAVPTLVGNVTIPAGVTLQFDGPSAITTTGFTLTINGPIVAGNYQIFAGTGTVALGSLGSPINAQWFPGATADAQINAAVNALPAGGGFVDIRGYGTSSQTIAATVTVGLNTGSGKTVTLFLDRTTTFTCTITNTTPCVTVAAGSTMMAFGMIANPNAGFKLSGSAVVSNVILLQGNLASNLTGGFIEGVTAQGGTGATVSDAICAVQSNAQLQRLVNMSCYAGGTINAVMLKIYSTGANLGLTNLIVDNVTADGQGGTGNRPVWIGCAASGSLTAASCTGGGGIQSITFFGGIGVHPGSGGLPIVTVESSNGAGGSNVVGNISFIGYQIESKNTGDIGILDDGAESLHIDNLYASCNTNCGTDLIKLSQPAGTALDGVTISGVDNQGGWTNTLNNTVLTKVLTFASVQRLNQYYYTKNFTSSNSNIWEDGTGDQAIIDLLGITAPRALRFIETAAPAALAGVDVCYGDSTAHALKCSWNNGTSLQIPQVIASGTATFTTTAVAAAACQTTVTVAGTGILTTDPISWAYNSQPTAGTDASLILNSWPTAGNVNFSRCNPTAASITPTAKVINWKVVR